MRLQNSAMILKCELWCESSARGWIHVFCDNVRRLFRQEWIEARYRDFVKRDFVL